MTNNNINTTPSTEAKTPATATTPATIAATTTAPVNTTATTPPAPATVPVSTTTAPSNMPPAIGTATATPASTPAADSTAATLPDGYLTGGYFQGEGKCRYTDPDLVGQAEEIGKTLAESNIPPAVLNKMVRTLKTAARLPYPAKQGALKKVKIQAIDIENRKKTAILREVVERNAATVKDEADYKACLSHIQDIAICLTAARG